MIITSKCRPPTSVSLFLKPQMSPVDGVELNDGASFFRRILIMFIHAMFQTLSNNCVNRSSVKAVTQMVALNNTLRVLDLSGT